MIIHFTHAFVPNSGELKRMKNIDKDVMDVLESKSIEVEFYPWKKYKYVHTEGQYTLSDNVVKKYYFPHIRIVGRLIYMFVFAYLMLRYKPTHVIGEMLMCPQYLWIFRLIDKRCKLIFDVHGASAEESEYQGHPRKVVEKHRKLEQLSVQKVDYIICQSDEMSNYLQKQYGISSDKICVYRCGVDVSMFNLKPDVRVKLRKELGFLDDDIIFVYSGGLHPWQRVDESIDVFEQFHARNLKSKMLVLTGDRAGLEGMILKKRIDNSDNHIITVSLPYNKVADYLNACDIAFLLRHNHPMNAVASPTKLAEYFACGLPIITSEVASKWVNNEGLQHMVFVEDNDVLNKIESILVNDNKSVIEKYAISNFSLNIDKKNLINFFESK